MLIYNIENEVLSGNLDGVRSNLPYLMDTVDFLLTQDDLGSNPEYVKELKAVINIFNIIYNNSPMEDILIDDGMYDMLVTKLMNTTGETVPGAPLVDFKDTTKEYAKEVPTPAVTFFDREERRDHFELYDYLFNDQSKERFDRFHGCYYPVPKDTGYSPVLFSGNIARRTHSVQHDENTLVGTLDKCKFVLNQDAINAGADLNDGTVKTLERDFFAKHIADGIITPDQELSVVISLKYDGCSIEADCTNVVERALSRGDTGIGMASDMTPVLKGYPFPRIAGNMNKPFSVKFEAIMSYENLHRYNVSRGKQYCNCRSAINGLFTASDAWKYRDYITLVPLEVAYDERIIDSYGDVLPGFRRLGEIAFMNSFYVSHGIPFIHTVETGNYQRILFMVKKFLEEAEYARSFMGFMYDGIVVEYADDATREKLGRAGYINQYAMAVKFNPLKKQTIFRKYEFTVGKNGEITPMIYYDPVEFMGTIHPKSSGHSYARFMELGLKPGDLIDVTYRNDVMPYVDRPDNDYNLHNPNPVVEFPKKCPICGSDIVISESGKSAFCTNADCDGRKMANTVGMLQSLGFFGFAEASVASMNIHSLRELMDAKPSQLGLVAADTESFIQQRNAIMVKPIRACELLAALGFTGMATEKWKKITSKYSIKELDDVATCDHGIGLLQCINGVGYKTAEIVCNEWPQHRDDIMYAIAYMNIQNDKGREKELTIRYTGFRDLQLSQQLCSMGYDAKDGSVTKSTDILLVPTEGHQSSKMKKIGPDTRVIPVQKFKENMEYYLNGGR